ncbi:MAG: hypothetical protein RBS80_13255 [Thermoguttaceae bacterium]|jgi:hypothetical protein|nr:hypothetical protein [Thermoguttaceae bacterium]
MIRLIPPTCSLATATVRCLLVLLGAVCVSAVCLGQEAGAPRDAVLTSLGDRVSLFFESLARDQASEAFGELLVASTLAEREDDLKQLVAQTAELAAKYGRYRGAEQIGARRVGQDLVLLRYLGKYEQCPVVWTFVFYRPPPIPGTTPPEPDPWRVVSLQFHTEWERLWDRLP